MNKNISSFFVAIKDNKCVAYGSNLSGCVKMLSNIEPKARNYAYYYRKFQESNEIEWNGYFIQKIV